MKYPFYIYWRCSLCGKVYWFASSSRIWEHLMT